MKFFESGRFARYTLWAVVLLFATRTTAETLFPKHVQYETEVKQDSAAKACNLILLLINLPAPEVVNLKLMATRERKSSAAFFGLSFDVGDLTFANGLPSRTTKAFLSQASFDSPNFSSVGRLNGGPIDDGGVLLSTSDLNTGGLLFTSFLSGQFSISFVRKGSSNIRTYVISQAPPSDLRNQFRTCLETLQ